MSLPGSHCPWVMARCSAHGEDSVHHEGSYGAAPGTEWTTRGCERQKYPHGAVPSCVLAGPLKSCSLGYTPSLGDSVKQ